MTAVDTALRAALNQLRPPCDVTSLDNTPCPEHAAWLVAVDWVDGITTRLAECQGHTDANVRHFRNCPFCGARGTVRIEAIR